MKLKYFLNFEVQAGTRQIQIYNNIIKLYSLRIILIMDYITLITYNSYKIQLNI